MPAAEQLPLAQPTSTVSATAAHAQLDNAARCNARLDYRLQDTSTSSIIAKSAVATARPLEGLSDELERWVAPASEWLTYYTAEQVGCHAD